MDSFVKVMIIAIIERYITEEDASICLTFTLQRGEMFADVS